MGLSDEMEQRESPWGGRGPGTERDHPPGEWTHRDGRIRRKAVNLVPRWGVQCRRQTTVRGGGSGWPADDLKVREQRSTQGGEGAVRTPTQLAD